MIKKLFIGFIFLFVLILILFYSQIWKEDDYNPYFVEDYGGIGFIYNYKESQPIGVEYPDDIKSIYFLKERNSRVFINDYDKKYMEYDWKYNDYECEVEIWKNTSIFRYNEKCIYIFIKVKDFWIRKEIDCSSIKNSSDFEDKAKIQELTNPHIKKIVNIYEKNHQKIEEVYEKGCKELWNSEDGLI